MWTVEGRGRDGSTRCDPRTKFYYQIGGLQAASAERETVPLVASGFLLSDGGFAPQTSDRTRVDASGPQTIDM